MLSGEGCTLLESLIDFVPIHNVPPSRQIIRTPVLIIQIVGVLPDIISHNGMMSIHDGIVLISGGSDFQFSGLAAYEPYPSAAKALHACVVELLLKFLKAAQCLFDLVANASGRRTSAL